MPGAIERASANSVHEGDLLEKLRSHMRSIGPPVETSLRSEQRPRLSTTEDTVLNHVERHQFVHPGVLFLR